MCATCIESFVERLALPGVAWEMAQDLTPRPEHMSVHRDHYWMHIHKPLPPTDVDALLAEIQATGI